MKGSTPRRVLLVALLALFPLTLAAQSGQRMPQAAPPARPADSQSADDQVLQQEAYASPPKELVDAVLAPRYLNVALTNGSPDHQWFLDEIEDGPVPMKVFSRPFHELGGLFVDFAANRSRTLTIRNNTGIQIISAVDGSKRAIQVPAGAHISNATWSPDSASIAFFVHTGDATHIWLADIATGKSRQITQTPVLATLVTSFDFTADGKHIATVLVPDNRPPMPPEPAAPAGPEVKVISPEKNHLRTYPSLMSRPHDFDLLEWHTTGQLALIDVQTRAASKIGQPAMIRSLDVSPDGQYVRVTRMVRPFSYLVPASSFGSVEEVWDQNGKVLTELSSRPINLGVQDDNADQAPAFGGGRGGGAQQGRRELSWRPDGQGFTYLEQDPAPPDANGADASGRAGGGRGAGRAGRGGAGTQAGNTGGRNGGPPRTDRVIQWLPPFSDTSKKVVYENRTRMSNHRFSPDMKMLFYTESSGQGNTDYAVSLDQPAERYALMKCATSDFYDNPGALVGARGGGGGGRGGGGGGRGGGGGCSTGNGPVLLSGDGSSVFYQGTIYDKDPEQTGPKTFIDKVAIKTGEKTRVFESRNTGVYERVTTILDPDARRFIVAAESPTTVPQYFRIDGDARRQITNNEDLTPDLTQAPKERFFVERPDGFRFKVTVTLPPGYQAGTRLPAIFWFYPSEFESQDAYDRPDRTFNKNTFPNFGTRSMQFFVRLGYAVVEPDSPIVGPQGEQNNNYVNDLRNDLAAVIDELDRRALVDRTRLAIGGHSYGAFSTVNAMVHTPFFKAGIAGDGNYNRTLTPLGFQNERRDLWAARDVYLSMSPFMYANNLTGALLMYHGLHDQNVGTDPDNSIRLLHALNGLGKTAALYMYPYRGPRARVARDAARPVGAVGRMARQVRQEPAEGHAEAGARRRGRTLSPH